jgi:hypothetical protein
MQVILKARCLKVVDYRPEDKRVTSDVGIDVCEMRATNALQPVGDGMDGACPLKACPCCKGRPAAPPRGRRRGCDVNGQFAKQEIGLCLLRCLGEGLGMQSGRAKETETQRFAIFWVSRHDLSCFSWTLSKVWKCGRQVTEGACGRAFSTIPTRQKPSRAVC